MGQGCSAGHSAEHGESRDFLKYPALFWGDLGKLTTVFQNPFACNSSRLELVKRETYTRPRKQQPLSSEGIPSLFRWRVDAEMFGWSLLVLALLWVASSSSSSTLVVNMNRRPRPATTGLAAEQWKWLLRRGSSFWQTFPPVPTLWSHLAVWPCLPS